MFFVPTCRNRFFGGFASVTALESESDSQLTSRANLRAKLLRNLGRSADSIDFAASMIIDFGYRERIFTD
jgi:hypothetical protein